MSLRSIFLICVVLLAACKENARQDVAFYYWKSTFSLGEPELSAVNTNACKKLYIKYFDIVKEEGVTRPVAVINFKDQPSKQITVPVVFIKNDVFSGTDSVQIENLARKSISLIEQINFSNSVSVNEIQWDCDWTETTKANYFCFLRRIKSFFRNKISATIRLHQVKYKAITGIPPVDKGILMYYNVNEITGGDKNSIYTKTTANKYINFLKTYSLPLDIALPIFGWGIQSRNNKVVSLLNKMNETDFIADSNFTMINPVTFSVKHPCFKGGYYFKEEDKVKIESIQQQELLQMADDIKPNLSSWPSEIIFYDLDSLNLNRYDKSIFKEVLARFN